MKTYVAGFLFNNNGTQVALVQKEKPDWQKGKFNGIGGKIEDRESPLDAMRREFKEETGLDMNNWKFFCKLSGNDMGYNNSEHANNFEVHFFCDFSDEVYKVRTIENEKISIHGIKTLPFIPIIPNLQWLIPMALEKILTATVLEQY